MGAEQPTFDPRDKKYQKVADLPEEEREKFVDIKGGGFITKEAAIHDKAYKVLSDMHNSGRSLKEKVMGTGKISKTGVAEIDAEVLMERKEASKE